RGYEARGRAGDRRSRRRGPGARLCGSRCARLPCGAGRRRGGREVGARGVGPALRLSRSDYGGGGGEEGASPAPQAWATVRQVRRSGTCAGQSSVTVIVTSMLPRVALEYGHTL